MNENKNKSAEYPLPEAVQNRIFNFWTGLLEKGLMTVLKYDALCSKVGIADTSKVEALWIKLRTLKQANTH